MAEMKPRVVVIGSSYSDIAIRCKEFPQAGETAIGSSLSCRATGSGVNQATQAALCGCDVHLISKVADDALGEMVRQNLLQYNINTDFVFTSEARGTGTILTMVNSLGENATCISPGANMMIKTQDIERTEEVISSANICLISAELPQDAVVAAIRIAKLHRVKVILDPAFGLNGNTRHNSELPMDYFNVYVLLPNLQQAAELAEEPAGDLHKAKLIGSDLVARGTENIVIKMGKRGSLVINREGTEHIPAYEVDMIDRTCAGDAFAGAFAASIAVGDSVVAAAKFGTAAGALACTKFGCQEALPGKDEIIDMLHSADLGL